jgi:hypothetical protein
MSGHALSFERPSPPDNRGTTLNLGAAEWRAGALGPNLEPCLTATPCRSMSSIPTGR